MKDEVLSKYNLNAILLYHITITLYLLSSAVIFAWSVNKIWVYHTPLYSIDPKPKVFSVVSPDSLFAFHISFKISALPSGNSSWVTCVDEIGILCLPLDLSWMVLAWFLSHHALSFIFVFVDWCWMWAKVSGWHNHEVLT